MCGNPITLFCCCTALLMSRRVGSLKRSLDAHCSLAGLVSWSFGLLVYVCTPLDALICWSFGLLWCAHMPPLMCLFAVSWPLDVRARTLSKATEVLTRWYNSNVEWPYPDEVKKKALATEAGISVEQVWQATSPQYYRLARTEHRATTPPHHHTTNRFDPLGPLREHEQKRAKESTRVGQREGKAEGGRARSLPHPPLHQQSLSFLSFGSNTNAAPLCPRAPLLSGQQLVFQPPKPQAKHKPQGRTDGPAPRAQLGGPHRPAPTTGAVTLGTFLWGWRHRRPGPRSRSDARQLRRRSTNMAAS